MSGLYVYSRWLKNIVGGAKASSRRNTLLTLPLAKGRCCSKLPLEGMPGSPVVQG